MDASHIEFDIFTIHCDSCGQDTLILPSNKLGLQYGVIFLIGESDGYIGTTCPNENCLNTILKKEKRERIQEIKDQLFAMAEYGPGYSLPLLRYHSFPYDYGFDGYESFSPKAIFPKILNEQEKTVVDLEVVRLHYENPGFSSNVYCSYFFDDLAICPEICILWLDEEHIFEVVKFENERGIKVFPRYIIYDSVLESADIFCYEHFLQQKFYGKNARFNMFNVPNPHKEAKKPYEFMQILTSPLYQEMNRFLIQNVDGICPEENASGLPPKAAEAISLFNKGYGKNYLEDKYIDFIMDYLEAAKNTGFNLESLDTVRKTYLFEFHAQARSDALTDVRYAFYEEPPAWTIKFDGKTLRGLKGKGFKYIHFLVSNKGKKFGIDELDKLDGLIPEEHVSMTKSKPEDIGNSDLRTKLKENIQFYQKEMQDAEDAHDPGRKEWAELERDKLLKEFSKIFKPSGKARTFRNESKKCQDRITKSIERAVNQIKKNDDMIGTHFEDCLKPINSYYQCYSPKESIDWQT